MIQPSFWVPGMMARAMRPMTVDEALYQMELVGHPFYLFIEKSSKQPCAVYHRHGWTYGVIRLDAQVL